MRFLPPLKSSWTKHLYMNMRMRNDVHTTFEMKENDAVHGAKIE